RARPRRVPSRASLHRAPQSSASRRLSILRAHAREPRPSEPSTVVLPSSPAPSKAPTPDVARCSALHLISHSCMSKQRPARRRTINTRPQPLCAGSGLNRCLRAKLSAMHVRYDAKENYYHFTATRDLAPRRIRYRSMQQMTAREVFKPYRTTKGDRILEYYRHNAFHGRFRRYEGSWYLQIDPTYRFTTDGRTIHPNARNLLSGIRKLERNQAVLNHVVMWVSLLQDPDTQDLFAPRAYPHLGFGDLVALESPVGIPDKLWAASESAENAQDGAPDDELLELAF